MRVTTIAAVIGSALLLAGCGVGAGTPGNSASPSASPSPSPSQTMGIGGPVAACAVGNWVSADTSASGGATGASGTISGGQGVLVKVGPNGITEVDFSAMQPAKFKAAVAGTAVEGSFVYFGTAAGQIRTGDATSLTGTWEPVGKIDYSKITLTADLTKPVAMRVFDKVPISAYTGTGASQTGGVVDADPLFGKARYTCGNGTLALARIDGVGLTWKLTKHDK